MHNITSAEIIISITITLLITIPVSVFLHEFGHAAAGLLLSKGPVKVVIGSMIKVVHFNIRRLKLEIFLLPGFVGYCNWSGKISDKSHAAILLAGPFTSALILIFNLIIFFVPDIPSIVSLLSIFASIVSFFILCFTVIPMNYPRFLPVIGGDSSDGFKVVKILMNME